MKRRFTALGAALLVSIASSAGAQTIFADNFDSDANGLNAVPAGWTISRGSVDIIGPGFFDLLPGHGNYLDLDGSTNLAGMMSTGPFSLAGGTSYTLSFLLAGSQRGDTNTVTYGIDFNADGVLDISQTTTLGSSVPFTPFSVVFTPPSATSNARIVFDHAGGDNLGLLLDNVVLAASIPEPQTYALMFAGMALLAFVARRRRRTWWIAACCALAAPAQAANSFTDDRGAIWSLFYSGAPLPDADPLHETFRIALGVDTNAYALSGSFIDQVALKVSGSLFAYTLVAAPSSVSDWTLVPGGLNANGCSGSGSGFLCADSAITLNSGKGVAVASGNGPGIDLAWVFDLTMDNGALFTAIDAPTIKARYVGPGTDQHLVAANITLIPEADTYAMIVAGMGLLGFIARRRRNKLPREAWEGVIPVKTRALLRFAAATWLAAFATCAAAEPITFIFTGTGTGSIGGTAFSDAAFTITGHTDTTARMETAEGSGIFWTDHLAADIDIAGLGDFTFVTPTRTFLNSSSSLAGFSRAGISGADLFYGPQDSALASWDLQSAFGPISGTGRILQWSGANNTATLTSGGELTMNDGMPAATFQAIVVPEPYTSAMIVAGMGLLGFIARQRRQLSGARAA